MQLYVAVEPSVVVVKLTAPFGGLVSSPQSTAIQRERGRERERKRERGGEREREREREVNYYKIHSHVAMSYVVKKQSIQVRRIFLFV